LGGVLEKRRDADDSANPPRIATALGVAFDRSDMSPETCTRVDDALAAGNVWGDAALLEHAKNCQVCARELVVLKKRREFRDAFPVLSSIADQSEQSPTRARAKAAEANLRAPRRRHLFLLIAALVLVVGFVVQRWFFRVRSTPLAGDESGVLTPPRFRIFNLENALFESKVDGGTVHSVLTRGVASFQVEPLGESQRFLLTLPDGDLEVRGTRFVVSVESARTQSVDVAEGTVALRLRGRKEMLLTAGERWPSDESGRPTLSFMGRPPSKDAGSAGSSK
jgi:hypothetical protein